MQISISQKLQHGYIIRLTHIVVAYQQPWHHTIHKTIHELKDTLQRIWAALLQ